MWPANPALERAVDAPIVRKLFAPSPKDPHDRMLSYFSSKFNLDPDNPTHECRSVLFLNRFTQSLTVMYATSGIEQVVGICGEGMMRRSFYFCIPLNCLGFAVQCLESTKKNDSIAYMRFMFRDPRQDDAPGLTSSSSTALGDAHRGVLGRDPGILPSTSSRGAFPSVHNDEIELEAVILCATGCLVVCLRRALPILPM